MSCLAETSMKALSRWTRPFCSSSKTSSDGAFLSGRVREDGLNEEWWLSRVLGWPCSSDSCSPTSESRYMRQGWLSICCWCVMTLVDVAATRSTRYTGGQPWLRYSRKCWTSSSSSSGVDLSRSGAADFPSTYEKLKNIMSIWYLRLYLVLL